MRNSNYYGLSLDADLQPLFGKAGVTRRSCLCFGQWRRGFSEERIADFFGITVVEATADIETVMKQLPGKTLATDIELRNQIIAINTQSEERHRRLQESLSKSASKHIKTGRNPATALRQFREGISEVDPGQVLALRKQSELASTDDRAPDISPETEGQIIAALRREDKTPTQKPRSQSRVTHEPYPAFAAQNRETKGNPDQKSEKNRVDTRVTVRLGAALHERILRYSQDSGIDISFLVREAVEKLLAERLPDPGAKNSDANLVTPPEAFPLCGPFWAWPGDLREELKNRFVRIVALAHVAKDRWPRSPGIRETYLGLIALCRHLGIGVRQNEN